MKPISLLTSSPAESEAAGGIPIPEWSDQILPEIDQFALLDAAD